MSKQVSFVTTCGPPEPVHGAVGRQSLVRGIGPAIPGRRLEAAGLIDLLTGRRGDMTEVSVVE